MFVSKNIFVFMSRDFGILRIFLSLSFCLIINPIYHNADYLKYGLVVI